MEIVQVIKSHPVPVAVGVVVLLLVVMASRSSSSSAGGYSTATMQNSTALAQINAGTSVSLGAQATERYKAGESAALERTGIAAGLVNTMVTTGANVSTAMAGINATMVKNSQDAANARAAFDGNLQLQQQTMISGASLAAKNLDAQIQMHLDDNNNKLSLIGAQTQGNLALMDKAGSISTTQLGMNIDGQLTGLGMNIDANAKSLPMILQNQQEMARITGQNAIQIAQVNTSAANTTAQAAKNKSDWGIVGNIASAIGSFFF